MSRERPIVIAGGGTGGHIFPGLALARELRRREPTRDVEWIGTRGGAEERLVPRAGFPLTLLPMSGVAHLGMLKKIRGLALAAFATLRLVLRFLAKRPALMVGVGGFASGPAVLSAIALGVPTLLLEQNSVPGRTNRALSRFASATATSFEDSVDRLRGHVVVTGNPVRQAIVEIPERTAGPVRRVLSFGGSRGAHQINVAWTGALSLLEDLPVEFVIQTGADDLDRVRAASDASRANAAVSAFLDDMPEQLAAADFVVARAGATTVAELTAAGRAAILIPYPYAADDHQRANARSLVDRGAAVVIDPDDITAQTLADAVRSLVNDAERVQSMSLAARGLGRPDATSAVADLAQTLYAARSAR